MKVYSHKSKNNKPIKNLLVLKFIKNSIFQNKKILNILKLLKIILKYYLINKKILILGTSKKITFFFKFINKFRNIAYIPHNLWLKGLLTNSFVFKALYFSKKRESLKFLLNFLPDYDIIVNLNNSKHKELVKSIKHPIIYFKNLLQENLNNSSKLVTNNFIYFLIYQIFFKFKHVK